MCFHLITKKSYLAPLLLIITKYNDTISLVYKKKDAYKQTIFVLSSFPTNNDINYDTICT